MNIKVPATTNVVMPKTLKCPVRVIRVFRKMDCLFSTDLELSIEQIIKHYGARWKMAATVWFTLAFLVSMMKHQVLLLFDFHKLFRKTFDIYGLVFDPLIEFRF